MSYQEIDGKIVLTMTQADFTFLLTGIGIVAGALAAKSRNKWLEMVDRMNEGNPHYSPYMNPSDLEKKAKC